MTVLIGLLCEDGVVVGSDSSATFASQTIRTIEQRAKKVETIGDSVIIAGTGQVGLGQRFSHIVEEYYKGNHFAIKHHQQIANELSAATIMDFQSTAAKQGQFGALAAFAAQNEFHLCEFAITDFQPEFKTDSIWYCSMGSGQLIADPFLGFLREVFWQDTPPRISEGVFYVLWALEHTINLNPGGINGPAQIATLTKGDVGAVARILSDEDLIEHNDNIKAVKEHLSAYKEILQGSEAKDIPEPPLELEVSS